MKISKVFISEDGKFFSNEKDCSNYESTYITQQFYMVHTADNKNYLVIFSSSPIESVALANLIAYNIFGTPKIDIINQKLQISWNCVKLENIDNVNNMYFDKVISFKEEHINELKEKFFNSIESKKNGAI